MFGYIKLCREELRVCEYELYRAVYCGLCRAMGRHVCKSFRAALSYDTVFLGVVRLAALGEKVTLEQGRCIAHPVKKRNRLVADKTLGYCARAYAVLAACKADDDVCDSKGAEKIAAKLKRLPMRRFGKKSGLAELVLPLSKRLENITALEKASANSPEPLADEFGHMLGEVFAHETEGTIRRVLYDIGYHTGRWIYFIDACDDFADDKKKGTFNPFSECDTLPREQITNALNLELDRLSHAVDLLPQCDRGIRNIIENTVFLGMPQTAKKLFDKFQKEQNERSSH